MDNSTRFVFCAEYTNIANVGQAVRTLATVRASIIIIIIIIIII